MNLHKMIEICLKDDSMHIFVMINALICINNYVITCINSMLSSGGGGGGGGDSRRRRRAAAVVLGDGISGGGGGGNATGMGCGDGGQVSGVEGMIRARGGGVGGGGGGGCSGDT